MYTSLKDIIDKYKEHKEVPKFNSERAELISKFTERLNQSREESGFKKLPAKVYSIKMAQSGLKTNFDLYWFFKYLEDSNNFSKTFWWSLNKKNIR